MPKTPKTKKKISLTLDIGLIRAIKLKAKENGINFSKQINTDLKTIYSSNKTFLEYELKRASDYVSIVKYKINKHNLKEDLKKK